MMGVGDDKYSVANQAARYAQAQALPDQRHLDIDSVYDGTPLKGMRVLVTGAEQGLGLEVIFFAFESRNSVPVSPSCAGVYLSLS